MRHGLSDPHVRVMRALRTFLARDPWFLSVQGEAEAPSVVIESFDSQPWASLTFSGMRHLLEFRLDGAAALVEAGYERLRESLEEADLGLAGHFLAQVQVTEIERNSDGSGRMSLSLRVEALTIEE